MRRLHHLPLPVLGLMVSVMALGAQPAAGQMADSTRSEAQAIPPAGAYAYTLMPDSSSDIKAAINETVSPMNFLIRGSPGAGHEGESASPPRPRAVGDGHRQRRLR